MQNDLNILILSCGTRNKVVQYFKEALVGQGKVIAADADKLAPALYEADDFFVVPKYDSPNYLESILEICKQNNIKAVLSLIDTELVFLAKNKKAFTDIGVTPIVSNFEIVELSLDKYKMYEAMKKKNVQTIKSYLCKDEFFADIDNGSVRFPAFVKPNKGSASLNINKVESKEEIELLFSKYENLIIQEFIDGQEYGIDVYIDTISKKPVSIFMKEKLKMRAGETDKSISIRDDVLVSKILGFLDKFSYEGIIDIDVFKFNGRYYISEVNPRFGGGYPHAHACGMNVPSMIISNLKYQENNEHFNFYNEGVSMMKYSELSLLSDGNYEK